MSETVKKEKVVNVGLTEELIGFLDKWSEKSFNEVQKKEEKPGLGVKRVIAEMAKRELEKIKKDLEKENITDTEWDECIRKVHKISELVQWY